METNIRAHIIIKIVSSMIITHKEIYTFDFQTGSVPMFYDCNRQSPSQWEFLIVNRMLTLFVCVACD